MEREHAFTFGGDVSTVKQISRTELFAGLPGLRVCVADTNTARVAPKGETHIVIEPGEASKSWEELQRILRHLLEANLPRDGAVIGLGGGVVCDIAACAGSLYLRGCTVVLIPTSLLAMVDAALGGKTGINFGGYKNMVGTFYPATEVRICTHLLHTLPEREYRSGLAEVIKSALLGDESLLKMLEDECTAIVRREDALLEEIVWRSLMVKGMIVEEDLHETGRRAFLNLGHTFAHALEAVAGLGSWSHGEAVAWGIEQAMRLGEHMGITDTAYVQRVRTLLAGYGYELEVDVDADALLDAMQRDKKRRSGQLRFVLQRGLAQTVIEPVDEAFVREVLSRG